MSSRQDVIKPKSPDDIPEDVRKEILCSARWKTYNQSPESSSPPRYNSEESDNEMNEPPKLQLQPSSPKNTWRTSLRESLYPRRRVNKSKDKEAIYPKRNETKENEYPRKGDLEESRNKDTFKGKKEKKRKGLKSLYSLKGDEKDKEEMNSKRSETKRKSTEDLYPRRNETSRGRRNTDDIYSERNETERRRRYTDDTHYRRSEAWKKETERVYSPRSEVKRRDDDEVYHYKTKSNRRSADPQSDHRRNGNYSSTKISKEKQRYSCPPNYEWEQTNAGAVYSLPNKERSTPRVREHIYQEIDNNLRPPSDTSSPYYSSGGNQDEQYENVGRNSHHRQEFDSSLSDERHRLEIEEPEKVTYHTEFRVSDVERFDAGAVKRQLQQLQQHQPQASVSSSEFGSQSLTHHIQSVCDELHRSKQYWNSLIDSIQHYQLRCQSMQEISTNLERNLQKLRSKTEYSVSPTCVRSIQQSVQDLNYSFQKEVDRSEEYSIKIEEVSNQMRKIMQHYDEIYDIYRKLEQDKEKENRKLKNQISEHAVEVTRMEKVIEAKDKDLRMYKEYADKHKDEDETYQILKMQVQTYQEDFQTEKELCQKLANQNEHLMRALREEQAINRELSSQLQIVLNSAERSAPTKDRRRQEAYECEPVYSNCGQERIQCRECNFWVTSAADYEAHMKHSHKKKRHGKKKK